MAADLQALLPGSQLAVDPDPTAYRSPWRTYRHALTTTPADATHRLVIQDDTVPAPNLLVALGRVIETKPDVPMVLFVSPQHGMATAQLFRACERGSCFAVVPASPIWIPVVAVIWPTQLIAPIVKWVDEQKWPVRFSADDEILGRACRALGIEVWMTVPSLVEHPDLVDSITRKDTSGHGLNRDRQASCFIAGDPLDIDWASG